MNYCVSRYQQRRAAGLCGDCGKPSLPKKSRCCSCRKKYLKRDEDRRQKGLCVACGDPVDPGKKRCRPCLKRYNDYSKRSNDIRLAAGLCTACGKLPIAKNRSRSRCEQCLNKIIAFERDHVKETSEKNKQARLRLRAKVFIAYGGPVCSCCGEVEKKFLCIDHINNGGTKHRRAIGNNGDSLMRWLKNNNFPAGFRILCANCNLGRQNNGGICPHVSKKSS